MVQWFDQAQPNQIPDFSQLGALGKIGLVLQNIADPSTVPKYQGALQQQTQQNVINQTRQNELDKQSALASLYQDPSFLNLPVEQQLLRQAQVTGDGSALSEYQQNQQITPYQQQQLALDRQRLAQSGRQSVNMQFIKGDDGTIYAANPSTGALSKLADGAPKSDIKTIGNDLVSVGPNGSVSVLYSGSQQPKPLTDSEKTKNNLAGEAMLDLGTVNSLLYEPDGSINDGVIGPTDQLYGEGRTFNQAIKRAVQNTLYLKTGASAPDAEVEKNLKNYTPSAFDNEQQINNKINGLRTFIQSNISNAPSALSQMQPAPPSNGSDAIAAELARRKGK